MQRQFKGYFSLQSWDGIFPTQLGFKVGYRGFLVGGQHQPQEKRANPKLSVEHLGQNPSLGAEIYVWCARPGLE